MIDGQLAAATGHPASVMDMSFATQALATEYVREQGDGLPIEVIDVPKEIEEQVAELKLASMLIQIDSLTGEQRRYLASSEEGT